jgi:hypothetical protein
MIKIFTQNNTDQLKTATKSVLQLSAKEKTPESENVTKNYFIPLERRKKIKFAAASFINKCEMYT